MKTKLDIFKDKLAYAIIVLTFISFILAMIGLGLCVLYVLFTEAPGLLLGATVFAAFVGVFVWAVNRVENRETEDFLAGEEDI